MKSTKKIVKKVNKNLTVKTDKNVLKNFNLQRKVFKKK